MHEPADQEKLGAVLFKFLQREKGRESALRVGNLEEAMAVQARCGPVSGVHGDTRGSWVLGFWLSGRCGIGIWRASLATLETLLI